MQNSDFRSKITSLYGSLTSPMVFCIQNSAFSTRIASLYGSQSSSVVVCIHNSYRINSLHGSQTSPVVLCMHNSVISTSKTSLYGSQPSSVVFAFKSATFGSELQVSMGPRPHLSFCACKTTWLALVSMGPSPHLWFLHAKQRILDQKYKSLMVPDLTYCFLHSKERL